jgi:hypothetical protein
MLMFMGMRLNRGLCVRMHVQMVFIVHVSMGMDEKLMGVQMAVLLCNVQPDPNHHEYSGNPKQP